MRYVVVTPARQETVYRFNTIREAKRCIALKNTRCDLVLVKDYSKLVMNRIAGNGISIELKSFYQF
jgi:tRNA G37 N-methylase Trm5